jgi:predicted nuclease with TOPRIM domain
MSTKAGIYELQEEHKVWNNKLDFYKDDITILERRLEELVTKNSSQEFRAEIEHFQNQFYIQRNNIDQIKHIINLDEKELEKEIISNPVAVDYRKVEDHVKERDLVETFEQKLNELRADFNSFSAKWM